MVHGDEKHVAVLGAGGHARVLIDTLRLMGIEVIGAYDDDPKTWQTALDGVLVRGPIKCLREYKRFFGVIGVGDNATRVHIAEEYRNGAWVRAIHPSAVVSPASAIGEGSVVFAGAVLQPGAVVGRHCIVNTKASIDHDAIIGDFVHLAPGVTLAGNVTVGSGAFLGIGATVARGVSIGHRCIVGAGAVVLRDLEERTVAYGVPAKFVRRIPALLDARPT